MGLVNFIRKYKIKAKKIWTVVALTIIEMLGILWLNNWVLTPVLLVPLVQFIAIFEHKDVWKKLSEKEKEEITLTEEELDLFVKGVYKTILEGESLEELLNKMKN